MNFTDLVLGYLIALVLFILSFFPVIIPSVNHYNAFDCIVL